MIKKIKALAISVLLVFSSSSIANALDSYAIGVTASHGVFEATGTETVASNKESDSGELEVSYGSVFAEVDAGALVLGVNVIPMEVDSNAVTNVRDSTMTASGTNTASVTIADYMEAYVLLPISDYGFFVKAGISTMDVQTKENLATGGNYNDVDMEGYHVGFGIEKDMEKAHVITDFIRKGFETGVIDMMTDGTEERQFLYAEDCCKALKIIMKKYDDFKSDDPLHITSFRNNSILEVAETIQDVFKEDGMKHVEIVPSKSKDSVQLDKKNKPDTYILDWWQPKTTLRTGIKKVFEAMRNDWV